MLKRLQELANPEGATEVLNKSERNNFYWSNSWRKMTQYILERDHYECQVCKHEGKATVKASGAKLIVHHIKPLEFYPEDKLDADNLVTVCIQCHNAIHFKASTSQWDDEWW